MDRWMDEWMNVQMDRWIMDRWIDGSMDRWIDGQMDRWMERQMDGWIDRWIDGQIYKQRQRKNRNDTTFYNSFQRVPWSYNKSGFNLSI